MVETRAHFSKRLKALGRKHEKMTHGYAIQIGNDGLITAKPKRRKRGLPIKGLLLLAVGFLGFKAFMYVSVGPITYNERLTKLENGTVIEQVGARMLTIDPVTAALADFAGPIIR